MKNEIIEIIVIALAIVAFIIVGGTLFFLIAKYFKWLYEVLGI